MSHLFSRQLKLHRQPTIVRHKGFFLLKGQIASVISHGSPVDIDVIEATFSTSWRFAVPGNDLKAHLQHIHHHVKGHVFDQ